MKKLLTLIFLCLFIISAQAQQNRLLEQSFWQTAPDVNAVKAEIDKGNNPAQFNASSFDPVVLAINAQAPNTTIEFLLTQPGNDITKLTHDGRTYLHWAAFRGNAEITEQLLNKGAKINLEDSHGYTPLLFAANSGQQNTKIYDLFIARGIDLKKELSAEGANVLLLAIANDKDLALTKYFVAKGLDLNSTDAAGNNAFSYAARAGNIDVLKTLVEKGVKPNPNAILMAAQGGARRGGGPGIGLPVYQYLESVGLKATVTAKTGENALHYIVRKPNQGPIIEYFISKGVDVNQADEEGNDVLMNAAAGNRDTAVLLTLVPKTKNINQANLKGVTALAMAVRGNSPDVVRLLIAKGADLNAVDKAGNNLAYYAIESYRPQTGPGSNGSRPEDFDTKLQILKAKGLDITAAQKNGNTLYHLALAKNDISLLKRIEPLGIDVNAKNKEGMTVLHKAALVAKDDAMLKYLLSIGAKKEAVTNFKETAFDLATENESLSKNKVSVNFLK
ncbi:ankyrin repeat domain-containing protein [Mucilaginibacter sp.]|uniref:ankyrin repeat domain-containing protein n=1 Tax=Mucilaginibacter sp. TaxID=1882438 RepID=UPI003264554A